MSMIVRQQATVKGGKSVGMKATLDSKGQVGRDESKATVKGGKSVGMKAALDSKGKVGRYESKATVKGRSLGIKAKGEKERYFVCGVEVELPAEYVPIKGLGSGSFGLVFSCRNEKTGQKVAVKRINEAMRDRFTAISTLREIQILRQIHHHNVISLEDVMIASSPAGKFDFQQVYLVHQLMDFDLAHVIDSIKLSAIQCRHLLYQILCGVQYLHSAKVIHRDLKPQNLLLNRDLTLKICDFGHARTIPETSQVMNCHIGTTWYKAPELLFGTDVFGEEIDMWSVGCTFAEMLGGRPLFQGEDIINQVLQIHEIMGIQPDLSFVECSVIRKVLKDLPYSPRVAFPSLYPKAGPLAIDLLLRMMVVDPRKRISAREALSHPYFSEVMQCPSLELPSFWNVRLDVDENPEAVNEEMVRQSIWNEMLFYRAQDLRFY